MNDSGSVEMKPVPSHRPRKKALLIGGITLAVCLVAAAAFLVIRNLPRGTTGPTGTLDSTRTTVKLMWDVPADHPDYAAISAAVKYGVILCRPGGAFQPDAVVSRAEFASMIARATGLEATAPVYSVFYDLTPDNPYYGFVEPAAKFLAGYEDAKGQYFKPNDSVAREDAAVAAIAAAGTDPKASELSSQSSPTDFSEVGEAARDAVTICLMRGWMTSANNVFSPKRVLTRAEAAVLMSKFIAFRMPAATGTAGMTVIH